VSSVNKFSREDEDDENENFKSSSSFTLDLEYLLDKNRNPSMPSLGVTKRRTSHQSNLSFTDAKKILMRELLESQNGNEYSFSSFDFDLER
jgi:hypothetical protein